MKDKIKMDFDRYEYGIIINALNTLRTKLKEEEKDVEPVDEILLRLIDESSRKPIFKEAYR